MNCIILLLLVLLVYLFYHFLEYLIDDKFETSRYNPKIENFFDKHVQVYVINMSKHKRRMNSMIDQFEKQKIDFIRVEAVNGKEYDKEYINNWPNIKGEKYDGTKGIQLSNIKTMKMASLKDSTDPSWTIILEDDNKITKNFKEKIYKAIHKYPNTKIFHLDKRWYQFPIINYVSMKGSKMLMGAMAQMYHKDVLPILIKELDYTTSEYMNKFPASKNREQVFDDYLHWLILTLGINIKAIPMNKEMGFETTIGGTSVAKGKES